MAGSLAKAFEEKLPSWSERYGIPKNDLRVLWEERATPNEIAKLTDKSATIAMRVFSAMYGLVRQHGGTWRNGTATESKSKAETAVAEVSGTVVTTPMEVPKKPKVDALRRRISKLNEREHQLELELAEIKKEKATYGRAVELTSELDNELRKIKTGAV